MPLPNRPLQVPQDDGAVGGRRSNQRFRVFDFPNQKSDANFNYKNNFDEISDLQAGAHFTSFELVFKFRRDPARRLHDSSMVALPFTRRIFNTVRFLFKNHIIKPCFKKRTLSPGNDDLIAVGADGERVHRGVQFQHVDEISDTFRARFYSRGFSICTG